MKTSKTVTINADQRLFVIPCGSGYTCLGFDVCEHRASALAAELASLGLPVADPLTAGTLERYAQYSAMIEQARQYHVTTGYRFRCELCVQLVPYEGKRVEVETARGEKRRFIVGKSTGWIPCHLAIARRNSSGGMAVSGPFKSVRLIA